MLGALECFESSHLTRNSAIWNQSLVLSVTTQDLVLQLLALDGPASLFIPWLWNKPSTLRL